MANITLTRVAAAGQPGDPTVILTKILVSGSSTTSSYTRIVRESWTVTDLTDPQTVTVGSSNVDTSTRSDGASWSLTSVGAPTGPVAAGAVQWGAGIAGGASHTGSAAVGYVLWGGAASTTDTKAGAATGAVGWAGSVAGTQAKLGIAAGGVAWVGTGAVGWGGSTLATETWTGSNGAAWPGQWTTATNGGTIDIQSNKGRQLPPVTSETSGPSAFLSGMTATADTDMTVYLTIPGGDREVYALVGARMSGFQANNTIPANGYLLLVHTTGGIWFERYVSDAGTGLTSQESILTTTVGMVLGVRFQVQGATLKAKIWDSAGTEPSAWSMTYTDSSPYTTAGKVGLSSYNGTATTGTTHALLWDDLTVTTIPEVTVPPVSGADLNLDWDTGDNSQWTAGLAALEAGSSPAHQFVLVQDVRRRSSGWAGRFEIHNDPGDVNSGFRSLWSRYDSCEGGTGGVQDFAWGISVRVNEIPVYAAVWELHQRANIYSVTNALALAPHALMFRSGQLQYRMMAGAAQWNGSAWTSYASYQDQIPILTGVSANTWYDVIIRIKASEGSDGLIQVYARAAGQSWPSTPNWELSGPTLQYIPGGLDPAIPSTIHSYTPSGGYSGLFVTAGIYTGSNTWAQSGSQLYLWLDELRRYADVASAKAGWLD